MTNDYLQMTDNYIFLAPEAVFPITNDENGNRMDVGPATGFSHAGTIQGEGKMAGVPALFVRTAGCNLRCMWLLPDGEISLCDTPFASFDTRGEKRVAVETVKNLVLHNLGNMNHLIVSGGEPFIQPVGITNLIAALKSERKLHVSVETNGTIFNKELVEQLDFFSISPKLKNSVPTNTKLYRTGISIPFAPEQAEKTRRNIGVIQQFIDHCNKHEGKDFQLKFVVQNHDELLEIEDSFLSQLSGWKPDDVVLMPLGSSPEELRQTRMIAVEAAIERGWRFSPSVADQLLWGSCGSLMFYISNK
jgi:7-carboxy-7-deazaguanine synthase